MTENNMTLIELLQKHDEGDFLRAVTEAVLQTLMEHDVEGVIGAVLFKQNDDWQGQHRYMQVEAFGFIDTAQIDPLLSISTQAA